MDLNEKLDNCVENVPKVYASGQANTVDYDHFWDTYQQNGNRTNYICSFGCGWTVDLFKPKYPMRPTSALNMFFNNMGDHMIIPDFVEYCEENNIILDFSNCTNANYALSTMHTRRFGVLDFSKARYLECLFYSHHWDQGVQTIDKFVSSANTVFYDSTFKDATDLTNVFWEGEIATNINFQTCTKLSGTSMNSIVDCLSTDVTGKTATFSKTAVDREFETTEGANDGSTNPQSYWNIIIGYKSNWNISLV